MEEQMLKDIAKQFVDFERLNLFDENAHEREIASHYDSPAFREVVVAADQLVIVTHAAARMTDDADVIKALVKRSPLYQHHHEVLDAKPSRDAESALSTLIAPGPGSLMDRVIEAQRTCPRPAVNPSQSIAEARAKCYNFDA